MILYKNRYFFGLFCVSSTLFSNGKSLAIENVSPIYGLALMADGNLTDCDSDLQEFQNAVDFGKVWALKVMDTSGRPGEGFLYGNNLWVGRHSQCQDIGNRRPFEIRWDKVNHTNTPYDYPPYELRFAMVMMRHNSTIQYHMRLPLDYTVQLGLCIPESCTMDDIFRLSNQYFSKSLLDFQKQYHVNLKVTSVRVLEESALFLVKLPKTIVLIILIVVIFVLTTIGTIYDVRRHSLNTKRTKRIGSNEIIRNTAITEEVLWVIATHAPFYQQDYFDNPPILWRMSETFEAQIISNATFDVDTFFFLSGFLLAYLFFKHVNPHRASGEFSSCTGNGSKFFLMMIRRYLRLTPVYAIIILVCDVVYTFYHYTSSLYFTEMVDETCDKFWWRNLLYINNLYPRSEMCLSWSWYLSADLQMFAVSWFLLLLCTVNFKAATTLTFSIILVHIAATAYKSYSIGYIATMDDQLEQLDALHDLPWNRIGPYLVGVITAYILVIKLKKQLILKKKTKCILWFIFPLMNLWVLFALYTRQVSVEFIAFYSGVSRTLWGVGIGWLIIAVSTGNARLLEKLLSYSAWIPLGRLVYCAYLLNPLIITMTRLNSEAPLSASISQMAMVIFGTIMIAFMTSFLFYAIFEAPFTSVTRLLFRNAAQKSRQEQATKKKAENDTSNTVGYF